MRPLNGFILVSHVMRAHNLDVQQVTIVVFMGYIYSCWAHVMQGTVY
jgi:hypothetical protein